MLSVWLRTLTLIGMVLVPGAIALATEDQIAEMSPALSKLFISVTQSPQRVAQLREMSSLRTPFCFTCHGEQGNSERFYIPRLAGQNLAYLVTQLEKFADGRRHHYVMTPLASEFSHEDRIALGLYFSAQTNVAREAYLPKDELDQTLATQGSALFAQRCTECHGITGMGNGRIPRLAGQHPSYIEGQLLVFHARSDKRHSVQMREAAADLSEPQIRQLAHYVASLK